MNIDDVAGPQVQCDNFTDLYFVAIRSIFCNRALRFFHRKCDRGNVCKYCNINQACINI